MPVKFSTRARYALRLTLAPLTASPTGPVNSAECGTNPRRCLKADVCECRLLWTLINGRISDVLNEFSLADMLDKKWYRLMSRQIMQRPAGPTTRHQSRSTAPPGA